MSSGMDPDLEQLIRAIHASPYKAVVYVTGGCAQVRGPHRLDRRPGCHSLTRCCAAPGCLLAAGSAWCLLHCVGGERALQQEQSGGAAGAGETVLW